LKDFSGKTAAAVKQDFYAKTFMLTLCAAFAHSIEQKVIAEHQGDQKKTSIKNQSNPRHSNLERYDCAYVCQIKDQRSINSFWSISIPN